MGFFDKAINFTKNSGIPGYGEAAGLFSSVTGVGADEEAPAPEYVPYQFDQGNFTISDAANADTDRFRTNYNRLTDPKSNPALAGSADYAAAMAGVEDFDQ